MLPPAEIEKSGTLAVSVAVCSKRRKRIEQDLVHAVVDPDLERIGALVPRQP